MPDFTYPRAPITEAVVEFRFVSTPAKAKRKKAVTRLKKFYEDYEPGAQNHVKVIQNPNEVPQAKVRQIAVDKFLSSDVAEQLLIFEKSLIVSQLAPYQSWQGFRSRVVRDWESWRSSVGFCQVERLGMRYINRIDIPLEDPVTYYENYVNIYPAVPDVLNPCVNHSVNVRVASHDIDGQVNVGSAVVESPVPEHMAIVLDIDVSKVFSEPASDDELLEFLDGARIKKNEVFEACISDKARKLFGK